MKDRIRLTATSHPDEDKMLVEIEIDGKFVAELVEATGGYELVLYAGPDGSSRVVRADLLVEGVRLARIRLDLLSGFSSD